MPDAKDLQNDHMDLNAGRPCTSKDFEMGGSAAHNRIKLRNSLASKLIKINSPGIKNMSRQRRKDEGLASRPAGRPARKTPAASSRDGQDMQMNTWGNGSGSMRMKGPRRVGVHGKHSLPDFGNDINTWGFRCCVSDSSSESDGEYSVPAMLYMPESGSAIEKICVPGDSENANQSAWPVFKE